MERSKPRRPRELPPLESDDLHFGLNCRLENVSGFVNLVRPCMRSSNDLPNVGSFAPVLLISNKKKTIGTNAHLHEFMMQFTEAM